MATVRIPTPLRKLTQGLEEVKAEGATVGALIADLETHYPGLKERLCDDKGALRPLTVKKGDRILFGKYSGNEIKVDGVDHLILREDDILGIIEK